MTICSADVKCRDALRCAVPMSSADVHCRCSVPMCSADVQLVPTIISSIVHFVKYLLLGLNRIFVLKFVVLAQRSGCHSTKPSHDRDTPCDILYVVLFPSKSSGALLCNILRTSRVQTDLVSCRMSVRNHSSPDLVSMCSDIDALWKLTCSAFPYFRSKTMFPSKEVNVQFMETIAHDN